ncbi:hypothetical protein H9I30_13165 [Morganella morganii]|uniref:HNH endonuclease n=1 Tax=Morganella morganii TaxID=582 RepID=UPI000BBD2802|nr:HNH endonuclease [Morganella morganii]HDT5774471.1 hypothetical protein [Morganella morganii subsp. morganii]ATF54674.1 hypothetical protein CO693_13725 [Morganella morganii]MBC6658944.1 hypothetical protein [Morganella morganii]MDN3815733.1 HNH endonuclease [Morganella morganii]HCR3436652.1 hypothetical protein [Morganella morganii]
MQPNPEKCIFCDISFDKGSLEHVFPSALGGRITTTHATCKSCNNLFSEASSDAVEIALADNFLYIRNALNIWSGRGKPPPTIKEAGQFDDGIKYDLAPNLTPIVSKSKIPSKEETDNKTVFNLVAQDVNDANRIVDILKKRGLNIGNVNAKCVTTKAPIIRASIKFEGNKIFRAIAKIAVVSYVVLYGNSRARTDIYLTLRESIRNGVPNITKYCGWDYTNDFPTIENLHPHEKTPDAIQCGFEHAIFITNVNHQLVAYIKLFGEFNFSVILGNRSGITPKCLSLNPTAGKSSRFNIVFTPPLSYIPKHVDSFKIEHELVWEKVQLAMSTIVEHCQIVSTQEYIKSLSQELMISVQTASSDSEIPEIIRTFSEKLSHIENGLVWEEEIDIE